MLDLFTIFSKGGIVLWYFQGINDSITSPVNALIKNVILQERGGSNVFEYGSLLLKYQLDNEFELVFVVGYQNISRLSYVDKFLSDVHLYFRDKYKNELSCKNYGQKFCFDNVFQALLDRAISENAANKSIQKMRTFDESEKSRKTVASMVEFSGREKKKPKPKKPTVNSQHLPADGSPKLDSPLFSSSPESPSNNGDDVDEDLHEKDGLLNKLRRVKMKKSGRVKLSKKDPKDKRKLDRVWDLGGSVKDTAALDYNKEDERNGHGEPDVLSQESLQLVGSMRGNLQNIASLKSEVDIDLLQPSLQEPAKKGFFSMFSGLVGQKTLTREKMEPVLENMKQHLIAKNVALEIAVKLCESVAIKLEGKVIGSFSGIATTVKTALENSLIQLLTPKRRVDVIRDIMFSKQQGRPFSVVFCGVNGVGKSTNLAKIAFWLIENNFRVLIAACDTFRSGAVEQLRTHVRHLNSLHPPEQHQGRVMVQLYEKGYGKDSSGIAAEAINYAKEHKMDVCLVDTAGRMQDNEPLMRALTKLIKVNTPDLVLFVGEALVGNEAVDQLVKFNQAIANHSNAENPRLIDGIVLTKFDIIDDKVGAAISMTYVTGQPIVFVGTGQTYSDLRNLDIKSVANSLLS